MRAGHVWLLAVALLTAGCIGGGDDGVEATADPSLPDDLGGEQPRVIIAVIDSGMNLYHQEYRSDAWNLDQASAADASGGDEAVVPAQLPGPEGTPVPLSLDLVRWDSAVDQDWDELMDMRPRTVYRFPGTKVVAGISFAQPSSDWPLILDRAPFSTHGTMTTSRAVGNTVSIPGDDPGIGLVIIQGVSAESVRWAAEEPRIDMISISSGGTILGIVPAAANAERELVEAYEFASHQKPLFISSGNGVTNAGLLGFPAWLRGPSGVPDGVSVGANDNANMAHWHNQYSYIAGDGCANPAATGDDTDEVTNNGGGTSSATPFSAGGGAKLLIEARRLLNDTHIGPRLDTALSAPADGWDSGNPGDAQIVLARGEAGLVPDGPLADGVFTLREFKDVLYHTALVTPTEDESDGETCGVTNNGSPFAGTYVPGDTLPEDERFPFQGYGEINHESIDAAIQVLKGEAELPDRPSDDEAYAEAHALKVTFVRGDPAVPLAG